MVCFAPLFAFSAALSVPMQISSCHVHGRKQRLSQNAFCPCSHIRSMRHSRRYHGILSGISPDFLFSGSSGNHKGPLGLLYDIFLSGTPTCNCCCLPAPIFGNLHGRFILLDHITAQQKFMHPHKHRVQITLAAAYHQFAMTCFEILTSFRLNSWAIRCSGSPFTYFAFMMLATREGVATLFLSRLFGRMALTILSSFYLHRP